MSVTMELLKEKTKISAKEKTEERKFILECIRLYEKLPALWNSKLKDYSNREVKNKQYEVLLRKYKQRYPRADKIDLIKKINSLRTNFRKEIKKLEDAKNGGHVEEPTLWYFDQMKFLLKFDESCPYHVNISNNSELNKTETIEEDEHELQRKKFKQISSADELARLADRHLKSPQDSCQLIATVWANKLSNMDRNQRIFAEKVINEVVFNGELGLLGYSTTLTNLNSIKSRNLELSIKKSKLCNNIDSIQNATNLASYAMNCVRVRDEFTDQESAHLEDNYTVEDYNPLYNSIKIED